MLRRYCRRLGALALASAWFAALAGGCSGEENAACVGVSCAPRMCGASCTASCGCCECADGEKLVQDGASYVCHGGCYDFVASDAGSDVGTDAPSDAASDGIDCSNVGCGPPTQCGQACSAPCGCCPCAEGTTLPLESGTQVCSGGCWAPLPPDGGADASGD